MASETSRNQRRRPRQARSRATWEAIVEAASQILERRGPEALNTNAVAERAGVSIGTLYQYFADKRALLIAAARRELADGGAGETGRQRHRGAARHGAGAPSTPRRRDRAPARRGDRGGPGLARPGAGAEADSHPGAPARRLLTRS